MSETGCQPADGDLLSSYLDSAVKFAYTLYSALERYAKSRDEIHFRKRRTAQLIKRKSLESCHVSSLSDIEEPEISQSGRKWGIGRGGRTIEGRTQLYRAQKRI
jgi:hypothetical protein